METRLSVFFQAVPQAISRFQSTEGNFQLRRPTHPRMPGNYFKVHTHPLQEWRKRELHQKSHIEECDFYTDMSKQCLGEILETNQRVESSEQPRTTPSRPPAPLCVLNTQIS